MAFSYRVLDDVALADLAFDVSGDSLQDLFQGAADALIESMADPATVGEAWTQEIRREDHDPATLLFDWLSDLVYWKDAASVVYRKAAVTLREAQGIWVLAATLVGERIDPAKQTLRADVKGVTKHLYTVKQTGAQWTARVVVDV